jgi:hypothetical protein
VVVAVRAMHFVLQHARATRAPQMAIERVCRCRKVSENGIAIGDFLECLAFLNCINFSR